jgi:hypothetical protein
MSLVEGSERPRASQAAKEDTGKRTSGMLLKRRDHFRSSWRPRYFLQQESFLLYFLPSRAPKSTPPRGVLPLEGCECYDKVFFFVLQHQVILCAS